MRNPTVLFKCYYLHCSYLSIVSVIDKSMELAQLQELFSAEHIIKVFSNKKKKRKVNLTPSVMKKQDVFEKLHRSYTVQVNMLRHFDSLPTCVHWSLLTALFLSCITVSVASICPSFHMAFHENSSKYISTTQNFAFLEMHKTKMMQTLPSKEKGTMHFLPPQESISALQPCSLLMSIIFSFCVYNSQ